MSRIQFGNMSLTMKQLKENGFITKTFLFFNKKKFKFALSLSKLLKGKNWVREGKKVKLCTHVEKGAFSKSYSIVIFRNKIDLVLSK